MCFRSVERNSHLNFEQQLAKRTLIHIGLEGDSGWKSWMNFKGEIFVFLVVLAVTLGSVSQILQSNAPAQCSLLFMPPTGSQEQLVAQPAKLSCEQKKAKLRVPWANILVAIPATTAFVVGYLQWRAGRHEASFEQYYSKLNSVNDMFSSFRLATIKTEDKDLITRSEREEQSHLRTMFVFAELDLLEYMLGKLRLGYVRPGLAERAIRAFISRCEEDRDSFRGDLRWWIGEDDAHQHAKGYEPATKEAVRFVLREVEASYVADNKVAPAPTAQSRI